MMITDHFSTGEFACKDGTALPAALVDATRTLCQQLELLRTILVDRPIVVISGYRTAAWNHHEGGAEHSYHMSGQAADIRIASLEPQEVHDAIERAIARGDMRDGGLGLYLPDPAKDRPHGWVHFDVGPAGRRWRG